VLAGYRAAGLSEVCFPGFNRRLFWRQGMYLSSRDVRFIVSDWLWLQRWRVLHGTVWVFQYVRYWGWLLVLFH